MANVELTEVLLDSVIEHDIAAPGHSFALRPCVEHSAIEVWTGAVWEVWVDVGSSDAAGVAFAPTGLIAATNVQAAIAELDTEVGSRIAAAVDALVAGAPGALDTLDELAAALGDDASFASSVTTLLAGKQASASLDADVTVLAEDAGSDLGAFLAGLGGGGGGTISPASTGKSAVLRKSGDQTLASGDWESVTWDTEDNDSLAAHSMVTNTSRITAPVAGVYFVQAQIATDSGLYSKIKKNGTTVVAPQSTNRSAPVGNIGFSQCVVYLNAGDYVEVQSYKGSPYTVYANNGGELPSTATMTLLYDASGAGAIGAPAQRVLLSDTVLSAAGIVDVSGLSQNYDDLEVVFEGRHATVSGAVSVNVSLNNDTVDANYGRAFHYWNSGGDGTAAGASRGLLELSGAGDTKCLGRVFIPSYTLSSMNKAMLAQNTEGGGSTGAIIGAEWKSTAAVNRIALAPADGGNFAIGTRVRVYGYRDVTEAQAGAIIADASWIDATYENGHSTVSGYATAGFRKDANGFVHLRGLVSRVGATGTIVLTLPAGYRPGAPHYAAVGNNSGSGVSATLAGIQIETTGVLAFSSGPSGGYLALDGISFYAEN